MSDDEVAPIHWGLFVYGYELSYYDCVGVSACKICFEVVLVVRKFGIVCRICDEFFQ